MNLRTLKSSNKVVGVIFARGGSKGVPGKNIKNFSGKPLIAWTIEQALSIPEINRVLVSTDSKEIAEIALQYGAEVPFMRPTVLALDNSSEWDAWRHFLRFMEGDEGGVPEVMLSLPATSPLRNAVDIKNCLDLFFKGGFDCVLGVSSSTRNPYFNMVHRDMTGLVKKIIDQGSTYSRRQDAPTSFDITTVAYAVKPQFVMNASNLFDGRIGSVLIPAERAIDIDTPLDFKIAEYLFQERGINEKN